MKSYGALCLALSISMQSHCMEEETKPLLHNNKKQHLGALFKGDYCCITPDTPRTHIIKLNISPQARDVRTGNTLLHAKIIYGDTLKISFITLLAKKFSLEAKNNDGKTPTDLLWEQMSKAQINSPEHVRLKGYEKIITKNTPPLIEKKKPNCIKAFFCCLCWRK